MENIRDYSDNRLITACLYCGGPRETREHTPSRVFLEPPLPNNLPIIRACRECNNGFSLDEEYLACLIECVIVGSTLPSNIQRPKIANILQNNLSLRAKLEAAKSLKDGRTQFDVEPRRIKNIILKLAQGHAAFELSKICREKPYHLDWVPLCHMNKDEYESFDACQFVEQLGEIGSRQTQRLLVTELKLVSGKGEYLTERLIINDWIDVQENYYRYIAIEEHNCVRIKIVIREYLACEVIWLK